MDLKLSILGEEAKEFRNNNSRVFKRFLALIELLKFRQKHGCVRECDYEQIAARFEVSGRTLYRWEAAYLKSGAVGLIPKKSRGRSAQPVRGHTAKKIREMRKLYNWGAEVIQAHLDLDHGIKISRYRINRYLRSKGLLTRKKCKHRLKHTKVVEVKNPGQHTQTDVKHLPRLLSNRRKCYVYNFVDHASKWAFKKAYDSYGPSETKDFMNSVIANAPFKISRLQSDNGVEFTNKYISKIEDPKPHALGILCDRHGIRHVLIPPGEKELQGLVERSHRQDDEELFHRIHPKDLVEFNKLLADHCEWRNSKRRRKALGWKTSNQFLAEYESKKEEVSELKTEEPGKIIQLQKSTTDECVSSDKKAA